MSRNYNDVAASNEIAKTRPKQLYALYAFMSLSVLGCFLPFMHEKSGTVNYVYTEEVLNDGIFVIALLIMSFLGIIKKKNYKGSIFNIIIALFILLISVLNFYSIDSAHRELNGMKYGIGFYLITVGLIGALIMSIILSKNSLSVAPITSVNANVNNVIPNPVPQVPNPAVQPVARTFTCKYCGGPRNEGMLCPSCGGK